jgi:arylacetamide deacetylase
MGKTISLLISVVLVAYYLYIPLPDAIEEPWKVVWETAFVKIGTDLVSSEFYQPYEC